LTKRLQYLIVSKGGGKKIFRDEVSQISNQLGFLFYSKEEGNIFPRNVGRILPDYTSTHCGRLTY
jgi:hypothetical protein